MALWLYVHFPRLALETLFFGDQRPLPQLLLRTGLQTIMQCNDHAINLGVRLGMNKRTAFCLLPDAAIAEYDPIQEQNSLNQLALHCYRYAADIAIEAPDGLLLEIGSMLTKFSGLQHYWQQLEQRLMSTDFSFQMSTGHTPAAARLLAKAGANVQAGNPDIHRHALLKMNVQQLGLDESVVQKLQNMGIDSYEQLQQLPYKELGFRFGREIVEHLSKLSTDNQPSTPLLLPPRFKQCVPLTYEAESASGLLFPLKRCLLNLENYLFIQQLKCEKLLIKLDHRDGRATLLSIPSVQGFYRQADWLSLLQLQFDRTQLINPVVVITLIAKDFLPLEAQEKDFFDDQFPESDVHRMQSLLIARLGENNVSKLAVSHDPRPEFSSALIESQQSFYTLNPKHWPTMLKVHPKPINIDQYVILQGPERIEAGWYDALPTRRDYYVASIDQAVHWVFRKDDGQWYSHGEFF